MRAKPGTACHPRCPFFSNLNTLVTTVYRARCFCKERSRKEASARVQHSLSKEHDHFLKLWLLRKAKHPQILPPAVVSTRKEVTAPEPACCLLRTTTIPLPQHPLGGISALYLLLKKFLLILFFCIYFLKRKSSVSSYERFIGAPSTTSLASLDSPATPITSEMVKQVYPEPIFVLFEEIYPNLLGTL